MSTSISRLLTASILVVPAVMPQPVLAQSAPAPADALEEVVVTAQKRVEALSKVPIAATAISQEALTERGIAKITDLSEIVPGLQITDKNNQGGPEISLRGVGSTSFQINTESTVALYLDELVLNPTSAKLGQMFDLQRVEVLRGPQGTLYGKNSTGGAINFVSVRPSGDTRARAILTTGRFGEIDGEVDGETGLTKKLAARLSIRSRHSDGYIFNSYTNEHMGGNNDVAGRLGLRYRTERLEAYLKVFADYTHTNGNQLDNIVAVAPSGAPLPVNRVTRTGFRPSPDLDVYSAERQKNLIENHGATLNADWTLGDLTLSSISGYLRSFSDQVADIDESPFVLADVPKRQSTISEVTQELRLTSSNEGRLSWLAGVVYFHQGLHIDEVFQLLGGVLPPAPFLRNESVSSYAAYADGEFRLGHGVSLVAGVRETKDDKHFEEHGFSPFLGGKFSTNQKKSWVDPSYRAGLNWQANDRTLLYLSYNHGYRAGGFDMGFQTRTIQFNPFNPEFVNNLEGGVKTTLFNNRLRIAGAVYRQEFTDQQVSAAAFPGALCCSIINAGKSRTWGIELEGVAKLTDHLDVQFAGAGNYSRYLKFRNGAISYDGLPLGNLSPYNVRVSPEFHHALLSGEMFLAPEVVLVGRSRDNSIVDMANGVQTGLDIQKAYVDLNGQAGYRAAAYSVIGWVKNATNERHLVRFANNSSLGFDNQTWSNPLSFGITVSVNFQ